MIMMMMMISVVDEFLTQEYKSVPDMTEIKKIITELFELNLRICNGEN